MLKCISICHDDRLNAGRRKRRDAVAGPGRAADPANGPQRGGHPPQRPECRGAPARPAAVRLRLSMTTPSWQDRRQERNEARTAKTTSSKTAAAASGIRTVVAIRLASTAFPLDASPRRRERPHGASTTLNPCLRSAWSGLMAHMARRLPSGGSQGLGAQQRGVSSARP